MNYVLFLIFVFGPPLFILAALSRRRRIPFPRRFLPLVPIFGLYTAPLENVMIAAGVWAFSPYYTLGPALGYAPLERYAFYILQALLALALTAWLWDIFYRDPLPASSNEGRA